jgi:phage portal protein BeeE
MKWEPLSLLSAEDASLVGRLNFSIQDVCRIFSVPPFLLGDTVRSTFASATSALQFWAQSCLAPWVARVERAFSASVLSKDFKLRIDL